jgi:hypothetical protein
MNSLPCIKRPALLALSATLAAASLISACGGGGDSGSGSAKTSSVSVFSSGTIDGFGSVIVNGVRYDDSSASIQDDDDVVSQSSNLKLGMVVDVRGSEAVQVTGEIRPTSIARSIQARSEITGPLTSLVGSTLMVLGQNVTVNERTVYEDELVGGLNALTVGMDLEIYGYEQSLGNYVATRVELKSNANSYKFRGRVSNVNTQALTVNIGNLVVSYAGVANSASLLVDGQMVKAKLARSVNSSGQYVVTELKGPRSVRSDDSDRTTAEIEGYITSVTSPTEFIVGGVKIVTDASTRLEALVQVGQLVEVKGNFVAGTLVATKVEREKRLDKEASVEVKGFIESVNTVAKTVTLRGVTMNYGVLGQPMLAVENLLQVGTRIEIEGRLTTNGVVFNATKIELPGGIEIELSKAPNKS